VVLSSCDTASANSAHRRRCLWFAPCVHPCSAETLVMSLVPISDFTTRKLMTSYYENLKQGMGRGEALRPSAARHVKEEPHTPPFLLGQLHSVRRLGKPRRQTLKTFLVTPTGLAQFAPVPPLPLLNRQVWIFRLRHRRHEHIKTTRIDALTFQATQLTVHSLRTSAVAADSLTQSRATQSLPRIAGPIETQVF